MASAVISFPANIDHVQVDSLVVMKIVKHFESERLSGPNNVARGYLTGLVATEERRLEITNCFPLAKYRGDDEEELAKQQEDLQDMLRRFRLMNIDYQCLGFYESAPFGACFTEEMIESMFDYQSQVDDSVVLIFDSVKTTQGLLSLKCFRLSREAMDRCYNDFSPESVKAQGLTYETLFEELPLVIKNSHLVNVFLCELALLKKPEPKHPFLDLGESGSLELCLRQLMGHIDTLNSEVNRYNRYVAQKQKVDTLKENQLQKRKLENEVRVANGETPLPLDEVLKNVKNPTPPTMLDGMLAAAEVSAHVEHTLKASGQNLGKLFVAEAILEDKPPKDRSTSSISISEK